MCVNEDKILRMKDLIKALTEADIAYYRDDDPVMSDREYDQLTDELLKLEAETGLVISGSPTQKVSGEVLEELTSVRHTKPMLSAKKTKSIEEMVRFAGGRSVLVSWKLDGLTIVLRYENGELKQSITRGREGTVGEDVTHTVRTYLNVPLTIPIRDSIEVRGEGVISWRHFNLINSDLEDIPTLIPGTWRPAAPESWTQTSPGNGSLSSSPLIWSVIIWSGHPSWHRCS